MGVYPTVTGDHHKTTKYLYRSWYRVKEAGGLPIQCRIHSLRHLCNLLVSSGTPIQVVADILGNDPTLCLEVYVHSMTSLQIEAMASMDAVLNANHQERRLRAL